MLCAIYFCLSCNMLFTTYVVLLSVGQTRFPFPMPIFAARCFANNKKVYSEGGGSALLLTWC